MSNQTVETRLAAIGASAYVTADEVLFLRRTVFADGIVSADELDAIFQLAERAPDGDPEWPQFFAEIVADFYLREEEPQGYLTQEEFSTLKARITRDGAHASPIELGLLVKLIETATQTTPQMSEFIADQFRAEFRDRTTDAGITKQDAALIKRYLFAAGGDGSVAITRAEAELLFDIKDATKDANNDPAWADLFVTGIINHLMAHIGYRPIGRADALAFLTPDPTDGAAYEKPQIEGENAGDAAGFHLSDMLLNIFAPKRAHQRRVERRYREQNEIRENEAAEAEKITPAEADWVANRIGRDGAFDANEQALISRMRELKKALPENLKALVSRAA